MKWTNLERLHAFGVRLVGWPEDVPLQNPSILKTSQNTALLAALRTGSMRFERLDALPGAAAQLTTGNDEQDISWAYSEPGEVCSFISQPFVIAQRLPEIERISFAYRPFSPPSCRMSSDAGRTHLASHHINELPPEVLIAIFDACRVTCHDADSALDAHAVRAGPAVIPEVCADWRHIALGVPGLWSDIHINIWSSDLSNATHLFHLLLARSSNCTLDVSIVVRRSGYGRSEHIARAISPLIEQSARWGSLHALVDAEVGQTLLPIRGRLPLLRAVLFRTVAPFNPTKWSPLRDLFGVCPNLTGFENEAGPPFVVPWEQLHRLYARGAFPPGMLGRLTNARALCLLDVNADPRWACTSRPEDVHYLPLLQKATLDFRHLRHVHAPLLAECHIYDAVGAYAGAEQKLEDVTTYIRVNSSPLTALSLFLRPLDGGALRGLLAECPALRRLQLKLSTNYALSDEDDAMDARASFEALMALMVGDRAPVLLPALRDLRLIMTGVRSAQAISALADVVSSRLNSRHGVAALQSFTLKAHGSLKTGEGGLGDAVARLGARLNEIRPKGKLAVDLEHCATHSAPWKYERAWDEWTKV
ncbi:hypothetical protein HDZ31DRAFT_38003 [Schizophyllum fasciatum]